MANILIVDDSNSIREMLKCSLNEAGHSVISANNGVEGLQAAKDNIYEVIISDVNMPRMNGIDMVKEIRQLDKYKFTPILMLTTETSIEKKSLAKSVGATGWMVKPFVPDKLLETIKQVL